MRSYQRSGLYTGIVSSLWLLGSFSIVVWLNAHIFHLDIPATQVRAYGGLFSILILVIGIYLGLKAVKKESAMHITYGQAVKTGILISVITGIIVALFGFLYCTVINPGYADFMVSETQKAMMRAHASANEINDKLISVKKQFSTGSQVMQALVGQIVVGSISSLIIGLFIRSKTK